MGRVKLEGSAKLWWKLHCQGKAENSMGWDELKKSLNDKKGILGILLPNQSKHGPKWISNYGKVYKWDHSKFEDWVEQAAKDAGR